MNMEGPEARGSNSNRLNAEEKLLRQMMVSLLIYFPKQMQGEMGKEGVRIEDKVNIVQGGNGA